jgi:hypothetical protein
MAMGQLATAMGQRRRSIDCNVNGVKGLGQLQLQLQWHWGTAEGSTGQ